MDPDRVLTVIVVIDRLRAKGWTLSAIARQLGGPGNTVNKWWLGDREPVYAEFILAALEKLEKRKRIPERKY